MKILKGKIISIKMNGTVVVEVVRRVPHPLYKKLMRRSKTYKVSMDTQNAVLGKVIAIAETRPLAKDKHFILWEGKK